MSRGTAHRGYGPGSVPVTRVRYPGKLSLAGETRGKSGPMSRGRMGWPALFYFFLPCLLKTKSKTRHGSHGRFAHGLHRLGLRAVQLSRKSLFGRDSREPTAAFLLNLNYECVDFGKGRCMRGRLISPLGIPIALCVRWNGEWSGHAPGRRSTGISRRTSLSSTMLLPRI